MTKFKCDNFRPVEADTFEEAARIFAERYARQRWGRRRGGCHHVRLDCYAVDGRYANVEAFVGRHTTDGGMSGRNELFTVWKG